jgi:hypothetical protein
MNVNLIVPSNGSAGIKKKKEVPVNESFIVQGISVSSLKVS